MGIIISMKFALALFLGSTSAIKLGDAPPFFNEPTWNEEMASAGGFLQVNACLNAKAASHQKGITCSPSNHMLFSDAFDGKDDYDMHERIVMKGNDLLG